MRVHRIVTTATSLLILGGCTGGDVVGPSTPAPAAQARSSAASPARQVETAGQFEALVDFSTLTLTPRGANCLLEVDGQLVFHGTIEGTATGTTTALVFATCEEVMTSPPGTHPDVFKSELEFEGTVDGQAAEADLLYMGRVQPGGEIDGRLVLSNGVAGRLEADARVAVGGSYSGQVVVR
jgi:hypothetical protein